MHVHVHVYENVYVYVHEPCLPGASWLPIPKAEFLISALGLHSHFGIDSEWCS